MPCRMDIKNRVDRPEDTRKLLSYVRTDSNKRKDVWNHKLERDEAYESWKERYEKWGVVRSTD